MDKTYDRVIPDYDVCRNQKVPVVQTPPPLIPGVDESNVPSTREIVLPRTTSTSNAPLIA